MHAFTASGVVCAFLAATAIFQYRFRNAFLWLALQVVIDATDGTLARLAKAEVAVPGVRGAHLDDLVDYVAYAFVPSLFVWRSLIVPGEWATFVCSAMLLSSALGFSRLDAKTPDHLFSGFPSYWNIVVFYLFVGAGSPQLNAVILLTLAALVFVPIRYVYPSRTPVLRRTTLFLGALWAVHVMWMVWRMPAVPRSLYWASLAFPLYYVALSIALTRRRIRALGASI